MTVTLTAAPRSTVTHAISATAGYAHRTVCGREIGEGWAGEYDAGIAPGTPTCKRCAANADQGYPVPAPVITRAYVNDGDTFRVLADGVEIGTVSPTGDRTGDRLARRAGFAEIVAPRFTDASAAEAYVIAGESAVRPLGCSRHGEDSTGSCVREAGHYGEHVSSDGYRWDEAVRWDHGTVRRFAPWERITDTGEHVSRFGSDRLARWSRWVKVDGMWTDPVKAAARARSMASHPAGKGRPTVTGTAYRAGMPTVPGVWTAANGERYTDGVCDWDSASALVTRVPLADGGNLTHGTAFVCTAHRHLI